MTFTLKMQCNIGNVYSIVTTLSIPQSKFVCENFEFKKL